MAAARREWANTFARSGIASMAPPCLGVLSLVSIARPGFCKKFSMVVPIQFFSF
jgi:hypothetical protein